MGRFPVVNLRFIKLYLPALLLLGFLAIGAVEVMIVRDLDRDLIELSVDKVKRATEMAHHSIETHHQRWQRGDYSLHEARSLVFEDIQSMQFGEDGHFFVVNLAGIAFVNSADPNNVGSPLLRDVAEGVTFDFDSLLAQTFSVGEAVVYNTYSNQNNILPTPSELHSIVYAKRFKPWSIVVGAQLNSSQIRSAHDLMVREEIALYVLIILIMAPIFWYLRRAATQLIGDLEANNSQLVEREKELSNSLVFFKTVTETAPDPIVLVNHDGSIRFCSEAARKVFGQPIESLVGSAFHELFSEKVDLEAILAETDGVEVKGIRGSSTVPLRLSMTAVELSDGQRLFTVIVRDLSRIKRLEAELLQASKLESVGQLAAGVAHEINTPAQFVGDNLFFVEESVGDLLAAVESIKIKVEQSDDEELKESVQNTLAAADFDFVMLELPRALSESVDGIKRVTRIVQAMRHYAHPSESMQRVNINACIEKTIAVSRNEWHFSAELEVDLDASAPHIECIASDINQAVLNVIVNASQAIASRKALQPDHAGLIRVSTRTISDNLHIVVEDNGVGMDKDIAARAFDPFFSTRDTGQGSGQGLSTAHKIVTAHGGAIAVDSVLGEGTLMRIELPATVSAGQSRHRAA